MSERWARSVQWCGVAMVSAALLAACTGSSDTEGAVDGAVGEGVTASTLSPEVVGLGAVIVANTPGSITTQGVQRVMTAVLGSGLPYLGGADIPATVRFEPIDGGDVLEFDGAWVTTDATPLGLYVSLVQFPTPGAWTATVVLDGDVLDPATFEVTETSDIPQPGDAVPRSDTPTATTAEGIAAISTDRNPDPDLYRLSIADAVTDGRPTVIAFATPAYCVTALCGPTLEVVREGTAGHDVDVVHVEPYDLAKATDGQLVPIPVMAEWGLVTEPWVFVVDADGNLVRSFEGIIDAAELAAALDEL